jgi:hypothetical protein
MMMGDDKMIKVFTNVISCVEKNCYNKSSSLKRALHHAVNSRHDVDARCYCGIELKGLYSAEIHLETCKFLGDFGCTECNAVFKDLVSANNHAWSAHGYNGIKGRHTFDLVPSVTFTRSDELETQVRKKTKWDHMQWEQIEERARNNSLKRTIIRDLLMESDFTATGSKIYRLAQMSRGRLPAFKRTLGNKNYYRVNIICCDGPIEVLLNPADPEFHALYNSVRDFQELDAQALFVPDRIVHSVDFGDQMNDIVRSVSSCLEKVGASVTLTRQVISFLCKLTVTVRSGFDPITIGAMLLDTLVGSGISHALALEVIGKVKDRLQSAFSILSNQFQAQVADFDPLSSLATIFGMIGGTILMQKIPSDGQMSSLVKGVCQLGNLARGATFAWSALERVVQFACEKIFEWQTGFPAAISEVEKLVTGCQDWYAQVQTLVSQHTSEDIARRPGKILEVQSLVRQGLRMKAQLQEYRVDPKLMTAFDVHFRVLQLYFFQAQSSGAFRGGPRVEPINVYIYGKSGVGKTGLINFLAIDMLKIDGMPKKDGKSDYTEELYYRAIEQEFWDGYCGQRIVVYDDFGQLIDSQQKPNLEYMEWIRTGNMAPMPLHMAHLQDKAKSFFTSRVVIATSNNALSDVKIPSLSAPEAFKRRIDICVEVTNASEFTKLVEERYGDRVERLDQQKVEKLTGKPFSTKSYRFTMRHVSTGERIGKIMDYDEFRNKCVKLYEERARNSKNLTEILQQHAQESFECHIGNDLRELLSNAQTQISLNPHAKEVFEDFSIIKVSSFLKRGHDEMRDLFKKEVNDVFDDLKKEGRFIDLHEMDQLELTDLETQWLEALDKVNLGNWWVPDAEEVLLGKFQAKTFAGIGALFRCLPMKDQYNHLHTFIDNIYVPRTENVEVAEQLRKAEEEARPVWKEWFDRAKEAVAKHPWLTAITALVALLGVKYWFDTREGRKKTSKPPLDHRHAGLKFGERVEHGHECEVCGKYFRHTHTIKTFEESLKYDQMCQDCEQWVAKETYDRADELVKNDAKEQCRMALGWVQTEVPAKEQVGNSGDAKTTKKPQARTQGSTSGDAKTNKKSQVRTQSGLDESDLETQLHHFDMREMNSHLQTDPNSLQLSKKVLNNMYNLDLKIDGEWRRMLKLMMIRGRVGLTAGHLQSYLDRATEIRIWNATKKDGHTFPTDKLNTVQVLDVSGAKKDQMLIEFPPSLHDHFDLVRNMATSIELSSFVRVRACIVVPFEQGAILRTGPVEKKVERPRKYKDAEGSYLICDRFEYAGMETAPGDCGSPLVAIGTSLARKLIGIHVCGKHNIGVASPLNEQDILHALGELPLESQLLMHGDMILKEFKAPWEIDLPEGNFTAAGESLYQVAMPNKTALRSSVIAGKLQTPTTAPSVLSKEAMDKGLKKAGNIPPELDEEILKTAVNDVKAVVNAGVREVDRVLTEEEAVQGILGDDFIQPIKRKTSPGYPYTGEIPPRKGAGKEPWLGRGEEYCLDDNLRQKMRKRISMAEKGERMPAPFIDTLKDERRSLEKIAAKKTRVFSAGAMDFTLVFRMYFLAFAAHVMRNRIDNEISVGTNVYSFDWSKTASRVTSKGQKVIAGDFSNFDGTLLLPMLYKILDIVNDFYNDGNDLIRHVLWKEIVNSIHVKGGSVYLWTHSQPSGCPITAILNSLYNSVSMRYVWMITVPREFQNMRQFNTHVAMVSYGDDNLVNISDEVIDYFNQLTIAEGYAQIGMTYTDEAKSGEMVAYRTLSECSYLKRGFVWDSDEMQWFAPLDFGTILEMTNWIRKDLDPVAATISNLETSHFELHLHGRRVFEEWSSKYWDACRHLEQKPRLPRYVELRYDEERKQGRFY